VLATSAPVLSQVAAHFPGVSAAQLAQNVSASAIQNSLRRLTAQVELAVSRG
jgi:hypothetical protein